MPEDIGVVIYDPHNPLQDFIPASLEFIIVGRFGEGILATIVYSSEFRFRVYFYYQTVRLIFPFGNLIITQISTSFHLDFEERSKQVKIDFPLSFLKCVQSVDYLRIRFAPRSLEFLEGTV